MITVGTTTLSTLPLAIAPTIRTHPKTPEAEAGVRGRGKEKER